MTVKKKVDKMLSHFVTPPYFLDQIALFSNVDTHAFSGDLPYPVDPETFDLT